MESLKLLGFLFVVVILPVIVISYIYSKNRVFFKTILSATPGIAGFVIILSGVLMIVYQGYSYLKTGRWHELPLMIAIPYLDISWIENPKSWHGLHKIIYWLLENIPFSLFLMLFGLIVMNIKEHKEESNDAKTGP